jgi:hypothetical protein
MVVPEVWWYSFEAQSRDDLGAIYRLSTTPESRDAEMWAVFEMRRLLDKNLAEQLPLKRGFVPVS